MLKMVSDSRKEARITFCFVVAVSFRYMLENEKRFENCMLCIENSLNNEAMLKHRFMRFCKRQRNWVSKVYYTRRGPFCRHLVDNWTGSALRVLLYCFNKP